jgi:hypothetical protein
LKLLGVNPWGNVNRVFPNILNRNFVIAKRI